MNKGWELFDSCFSEKDEVIVIDTDDRFFWGRLRNVTDHGCELHKRGRTVELKWDDVRFMAHDGFPVRKLLGASGSSTIEKLDTKDTQTAIHKALEFEFPQERTRKFRVGDPFDIECSSARLFHPGNSGFGYWGQFCNESRYFSKDHREEGYAREEVLVLSSKDGAMAELWDPTTIYMFEEL